MQKIRLLKRGKVSGVKVYNYLTDTESDSMIKERFVMNLER